MEPTFTQSDKGTTLFQVYCRRLIFFLLIQISHILGKAMQQFGINIITHLMYNNPHFYFRNEQSDDM